MFRFYPILVPKKSKRVKMEGKEIPWLELYFIYLSGINEVLTLMLGSVC